MTERVTERVMENIWTDDFLYERLERRKKYLLESIERQIRKKILLNDKQTSNTILSSINKLFLLETFKGDALNQKKILYLKKAYKHLLGLDVEENQKACMKLLVWICPVLRQDSENGQIKLQQILLDTASLYKSKLNLMFAQNKIFPMQLDISAKKFNKLKALERFYNIDGSESLKKMLAEYEDCLRNINAKALRQENIKRLCRLILNIEINLKFPRRSQNSGTSKPKNSADWRLEQRKGQGNCSVRNNIFHLARNKIQNQLYYKLKKSVQIIRQYKSIKHNSHSDLFVELNSIKFMLSILGEDKFIFMLREFEREYQKVFRDKKNYSESSFKALLVILAKLQFCLKASRVF